MTGSVAVRHMLDALLASPWLISLCSALVGGAFAMVGAYLSHTLASRHQEQAFQRQLERDDAVRQSEAIAQRKKEQAEAVMGMISQTYHLEHAVRLKGLLTHRSELSQEQVLADISAPDLILQEFVNSAERFGSFGNPTSFKGLNNLGAVAESLRLHFMVDIQPMPPKVDKVMAVCFILRTELRLILAVLRGDMDEAKLGDLTIGHTTSYEELFEEGKFLVQRADPKN